jgi:O-antigen ligase
VKFLRLEYLNLAFVLGAFISSLFFNGIDIRFFSLSFILLLGWLFVIATRVYSNGYHSGKMLLPISILLFWFWLGLNIFFSPVFYLTVVNFWWVGIFPLMFLAYIFTTDKNKFWKHLFPALIIIVTALCVYALYQMFVLHMLPRATFFNMNSLAALINLLLLPLLAFLFNSAKKSHIYAAVVSVFLFTLVLGLINSRAALLAFIIGLVLLIVLTYRQLDKKRLLLVGAVIMTAFITAQLHFDFAPRITGTGTVDRLLTLQDTQSAGHSRFVIWQPAWELFLQHRWTGIGLGTYFLAIPPTLHPEDHSAGFYVHNDYLQIALETGIPGLLLLVLILLVTLSRFISVLRADNREQIHRVETVALFAALLTLAFHSVFSFNLYVMPVMFITGLLLGRFNQLADLLIGQHLMMYRPSHLFRPSIYYTLVGIICLTLASYFISRGIAYHYQHKGYQLAAQNQLGSAHRAYHLAQRLAPRVDSSYYADADLLRISALALSTRPELAHRLLAEAQTLLARAEQLNPLRPQTPYIRGLVLEMVSTDTTPATIIQTYETALGHNPRFLPARLALARYLITHGQQEQAQQILWQGLAYRYRQVSPAYLELLEMNLAMANQMGNKELATQLTNVLVKSRQNYASMLSAQGHNSISNPY